MVAGRAGARVLPIVRMQLEAIGHVTVRRGGGGGGGEARG